ncbi:uncharacterized protein LOC121381206 isoform X2 [Gigantopelta aegis]|nr:uncharacterized protein LOC121381206 isoform X2 [Gigantopelta aegis]XP_041366337.1 uncharacterized protein LOC121381206 isoform X2 [Gigantopelta aegis]
MGCECGKKEKQVFRERRGSVSSGKTFRAILKKSLPNLRNIIKAEPGVTIVQGKTVVIFVFGGPSSKKGIVVNDLINTFDFKLIKMENLLLAELAEKKNSDTFRTNWIFELLRKEISNDPQSMYLIDMIPNLHGFVNNESFVRDPTSELKEFEIKFPISFAINFCAEEMEIRSIHNTAQKLLANKRNESLVPADPDMDSADHPVENVEISHLNQKVRTLLYENAVKHYLAYFSKSKRLVTVNTGLAPMPFIWGALCRIFSDFQIISTNSENIQILFTFDGEGIPDEELCKHGLIKIDVHSELDNSKVAPEAVLQTVNQLIGDHDPSSLKFYVNLHGTSVVKGAKFKTINNRIAFVDSVSEPLSEAMPIEPVFGCQCSCSLRVKTIGTPENATCYFPEDTDIQLCKHVAYVMSECIKNGNNILPNNGIPPSNGIQLSNCIQHGSCMLFNN